MLDFELYGLNPKGHLVTNVLLHIVNTILLLLLLKRMTGSLWRSGFVAALFALHPLHVESVAWVAERKDVLSTLFWMLTMWAYVRYVECRGTKRYLLILLSVALGLMAKPMLVTLPFVLLLLDFWPLARFRLDKSAEEKEARTGLVSRFKEKKALFFRLVWEKAPLFALAGASSVATFLAQRVGGAVVAWDKFPLNIRVTNALASYVKYMVKMIWPTDLAFFYPHPGANLLTWQIVGAGVLLLCITVLIVRAALQRPYLIMGWLWYLGTLVPVIGLVQVGGQAMADRYTYVPLIGLFIIIAWGIPELVGKWKHKRVFLAISSTAVLIGLMVCTWLQVGTWRNSVALFEHALSVSPQNHVAHNNLGLELAKEGKTKEAVYHYSEAVRIRPTYDGAHNNLGHILQRQGRLAEADVHLREALRLNPKSAAAHNNLGIVLERQGRLEEAISHYNEALRLKPDHVKAYNNLGIALARQGRLEEAILRFSEALRINPNLAETHNNLGIALVQQGKLEEAIFHFSEAVRIKPDYEQAKQNLEFALRRTGGSR
jgi:Flp pilus assembly protein TadD